MIGKPRMVNRALLTLVSLILFPVLTAWTYLQVAGEGWAPMNRIPGLEDSSRNPILVTDQNRMVHLFHSQSVVNTVAIVYSRWEVTDNWSTPVDILFPLRGQAQVSGVVLDQEGYFHLVAYIGDARDADMFYTRAPAVRAGMASAWTEWEMIGPGALSPHSSVLVGDTHGNLTSIYSGNLGLEGHGIFETRSEDGGETWSKPRSIFFTQFRTLWPSAIKAYTDDIGNIHLVWAVANVSGNGEEVYYAQRNIRSGDWSEPFLLAESQGYESDTPSVVKHGDQLIVIFHNGSPTRRWMTRSFDNGRTWTDPVQIFQGHVGSNGYAEMVVDSSGQLHMLFGNRIGNPAVHGMWHSLWIDEIWTQPEPVVSGLRISDIPGGEGFDPSHASAAVAQGNTLLVTWRTDPGAGPNGIWYSYKYLENEELPLQTLPVPEMTATITSTPTETPEPSVLAKTPTPGVVFVPDVESDEDIPDSPYMDLATSLGPVLLLVTLIVVYQRRKR